MDYNGYDYTELFDVLGITWSPEDDSSGQHMDEFKRALSDAVHNDTQDESRTRIDHTRSYVRAMSEHDHGFWSPIWCGLCDCKDDFTFMQACHALAEHMWT